MGNMFLEAWKILGNVCTAGNEHSREKCISSRVQMQSATNMPQIEINLTSIQRLVGRKDSVDEEDDK